MRKKSFLWIALCLLLLMIDGCAPKQPAMAPAEENGRMTVSFDYAKQSGYATNQFAVWVEDANGVFVKTLYATRFTVNGGYQKRPDSIPVWVERSGISALPDTDATTGATPGAGTLTYLWDMTGTDGIRVTDGTYRFYVEGTLRWKNSVLYTGEIEIGDAPAAADATAAYHFEASADAPALTEDSPESAMITNVTAEYAPPVQ